MFFGDHIFYNNCSFFTPLNNAYFGEGIEFNNVPFTTYGVGDILGVVFSSMLWEYHQLKR